MGNSPAKPEHLEEPPREFSLANKNLKLDTAADVEVYVEAIRRAKNLTVVSLNGNTFGVEAARALSEALKTHNTIQEINLNDCFTGRLKEEVPQAMELFCKALMSQSSLTKVDFSDNAFGPIGAKAIQEYLSGACGLEVLRLNNNGLGPDGGRLIGESLLNCHQSAKSRGKQAALRVVSIGRNRLENASIESLGRSFEALSQIEEISLYQNGIRPEGIVSLSRSLAKCSNLKYIDLQDNTFTDVGAKAFSEALASLPKLGHLNLGDCLLGPSGSLVILQSLFGGSASLASGLTFLNMQYNEIDEKVALFIADNAVKFSALKRLFLNGNNFKSEGKAAQGIKKSLAEVNKLEVLDEWDDMEADAESDEEGEEETSEDEALINSIGKLEIN